MPHIDAALKKRRLNTMLKRAYILSLTALVVALSTPAVSIQCTHQRSMSQAEMLHCMRLCNSMRPEIPEGSSSVAKDPCMSVDSQQVPAWLQVNLAPQQVQAFATAVTADLSTAPAKAELLSVATRGPPGPLPSLGLSTSISAHGPPLG